MHMGADGAFAAGDRVQLANGTRGVVLREVRDNGFRSFIVQVTDSVAPHQVDMTVGATPTYMDKIALHLAGRVIRCALALTPEEQARGLQGSPPLLADEGLLFVFPDERARTFHMGSVSFPIDIVWFDAAGEVTQTVEHAQPGDRSRWTAKAAFVLELPGGSWSKYDETDVRQNRRTMAQSYDVLRGITGDEPVHKPSGPHTSPVDAPGGDVHAPAMSWPYPEQDDQPMNQGTSPGARVHLPPDERFRHHETVDNLYTEQDSVSDHWQSTMGRDPMRNEELADGGNRISAAKGPKITNPAAFATALVDAIREGAGLTWQTDELNGEATESAHITANNIRRWFQRLGVNDFSTAMEAALSPEGLNIIGDTFVLAGMADMARLDRDNRGLTLFRQNEST